MRFLTKFACGLLFGLGLAVADMTSPQKILAFLDVAGEWDPSLLVVLATAAIVSGVGYWLAYRRRAPAFGPEFSVPHLEDVDLPLILGSALFGVGWGISGYCPGAAVTLLANPSNPEALTYLSSLALGYVIYARLSTAPR